MAQSGGLRIRLLVAAAAVALLILTGRGVSEPSPIAFTLQIPETIHACVTPAGTMYLIKQPGLKQECSGNHMEVSWNTEGPQGPAGISGLRVVTGPVAGVDPGTSSTSHAQCPEGELVTGGGFTITSFGTGAEPIVGSSRPSGSMGDEWVVVMHNLTGTAFFAFQAYAVCASGVGAD
jgi:hypothetical protein